MTTSVDGPPGPAGTSGHRFGGVSWVDLGVADVDAAAAFYTGLFGWEVAAPDQTGYRLARLRGHLVAAFGPGTEGDTPYWTIYVQTADLVSCVAAVAAAGGTVVAPPAPADEAGWAAVVRDPHGVPLSLWQPGRNEGSWLNDEPGALAGVQLRTEHILDTGRFLTAALQWSLEPGGTIMHEGRQVATWTSQKTLPPWLVSFRVGDVPSALKRARALGARIVDGMLIDVCGAAFAFAKVGT